MPIPIDVELDVALVRAARSDASAFGELYDRHSPALLAYFYRRLACPHTAADLTSETFAAALAHLDRFDLSRGTPRAWLFGIASKQLATWYRRGKVAERARRKMGVTSPVLEPEDIERIETLADMAPLRAQLREALSELSPAVRDAVVLRVGFDMPYQEVADRLAVSVGTARVRVSRGLTQLFDLMEVPSA